MRCTTRPRGDAGSSAVELVCTLPFVLALMLIILAVGRAYLIRQRTTVAARYAAWREAQDGGDADADLVAKQSHVVLDRIDRGDRGQDAFGETLPHSGFGLRPIANSLAVLADMGPPGLDSVGGTIRSMSGGLGGVLSFASIDVTCRDLRPDPQVTVHARVSWAGARMAFGGEISRRSRLVRDVWVTSKEEEGFWRFFLKGMVGKVGKQFGDYKPPVPAGL